MKSRKYCGPEKSKKKRRIRPNRHSVECSGSERTGGEKRWRSCRSASHSFSLALLRAEVIENYGL